MSASGLKGIVRDGWKAEIRVGSVGRMRHALMQAAAMVFLITGCSAQPYLPKGSYAGCFLAPGGQRLRLSPNGSIVADGQPMGQYKVIAPVGGKHGPLVEATGLNVRSYNGNVDFVRGSGGFFWKVSNQGLEVMYGPDGDVYFVRSLDAVCK